MGHCLKVVFMGTPAFAVSSLEAIAKAGYEIAAVVTAPDKPAGRGLKVQPSPVKSAAENLNIPVLQPEKLKDPEFLQQLAGFHADVFVVVAFRMLPEQVWTMPPKGTFNLHASLLPQYRGAAPIQWAVINGEVMTGLTTFFLEKEIDTGNIILRQEIPILPTDDAGKLHDKLMEAGGKLIVQTLEQLEKGEVNLIDQSQLIRNQNIELKPAPKIFKSNSEIHWEEEPEKIHNLVRGLSPYPGAWTTWENSKGERLTVKIFGSKVSYAHTTPQPHLQSDGKNALYVSNPQGSLYITELQVEGKKRMDTASFLRGFDIAAEGWDLMFSSPI